MEKKKFWRKSPKLSRNFGEFSKIFGKVFNIRKKINKKNKMEKKQFWRKSPKLSRSYEEFSNFFGKIFNIRKKTKNGEKKIGENLQNSPKLHKK